MASGLPNEQELKEASEESGIPISSMYKAARELGISIERAGSLINWEQKKP